MSIRTLCLSALVAASVSSVPALAQTPPAPNPAMTAPDQYNWQIFASVVAPVGGAPAFLGWATDAETFVQKPTWPGSASAAKRTIAGKPRALLLARPQAILPKHALAATKATPNQPLEIVFRNQDSFNYIVSNNLQLASGLALIAAKNTPIQFPTGAIEVKTNWVDASTMPQNGAPFFTNTFNGATYALVAMHVTSKQLPNWTWATFEYQGNAGRCDYIGCNDAFGSVNPSVPPQNVSPATTGQTYLGANQVCTQTSALHTLFTSANVPQAFSGYCLKGSQIDFTTADGLAIRLGNSVTENGFVQQSSCMTCHGRAAYTVTTNAAQTSNTGIKATSNAGFDPVSGTAPIGPVDPAWFYTAGSNPPLPMFVGESTLIPTAERVDFVWSIPFCAVNDLVTPVQPSQCTSN